MAAVARVAVPAAFPARGHIFAEGDEARGFYIVESGSVKVYKLSGSGREQVIHHLGRGEAFEVALFAGGTYPASAMALSPTRVVFFPKKDFLHLIGAKPALALSMIGTLALRLREFARLVEVLSLKDVSARLAAYLLELSREQASLRLTLPCPKAQLAAQLGAAQETLSRSLRRLREAGLLEVAGRRVAILKPEGLAKVAEAPQK